MSSAARCHVWRQPVAPDVKLVLLALADVADEEGTCQVCLPFLATRTGLTVDSIRRVLLAAERRGLLRHAPPPCADRDITYLCQLNLVGPRAAAVSLPAAEDGADGETEALHWPTQLSVSSRTVYVSLLSGLPLAVAQMLLDELTAALDSGRIIKTTPLRWFAGIVRRYRAGAFTPGAGLAVASRRLALPAPSLFSPLSRDAVRAHLAQIKSQLNHPPALSIKKDVL